MFDVTYTLSLNDMYEEKIREAEIERLAAQIRKQNRRKANANIGFAKLVSLSFNRIGNSLVKLGSLVVAKTL